MAKVTGGTHLNVIMVDEAGNKASYNFALNYADLDALNTAHTAGDVDQIIADLEAVTGAAVVSYSFGEKMVEDGPILGGTGSEVENIALITAKIDGSATKTVSLRVPAPDIGIFVGATGPNKNVVDSADAGLVTFLEHMGPSGEILVSDGEQIADPNTPSNFKGKRIHRASRKG